MPGRVEVEVSSETEHRQDPLTAAAQREPLVLAVDDDPAALQLYAGTLARHGIASMLAPNGEVGLDAVEHHPVSLVLLDSTLPGMSGLDVLRRLRGRPETRTLPVILVTGKAESDDVVRGLEAGADDYVTKPVVLDELVARVQAHLRSQSSWNDALSALEQRAAVADLLGRMPTAGAPAARAEAICRELTGLRWLEGAALVSFAGPGAVVLAGEGIFRGLFPAGSPLPHDQAAWLQARAHVGPWMEDLGDGDPWTATGRPTPGVLAGTPLRSGGGILGVALVGTPPRTASSRELGVSALSASIDLASVANVLLAADLEHESERQEAARRLVGIVSDRAFTPHFQPIVDIASGTVVGYEALTRWGDGARPDLRFAEAADLGVGLDVERATAVAALEDSRLLDPAPFLSLNVSAALVLAPGMLGDILARAVRPVVLELTEHEPVSDYDALCAALDGLGPDVRVSVDDAGAGYASLSHVLAVSPDFVKLDIHWIRGIDTDAPRRALVAGLRHFTDEIGCEVVAEGIETAGELDVVRRLGVELGQGYLLGRPAPAAVLAAERTGG